jgi:hypothetical protein
VKDCKYETQFMELCGTGLILARKEGVKTFSKQLMTKSKFACKLKHGFLGCLNELERTEY